MRFLLLFNIFLVLICGGCGTEPAQNTPAKKDIVIWLDAPEREMEFFKKTARIFEEKNPSVSIKFKFIQFDDLKPRFIGQKNDSTEPDIIFLVNDWIGELAEAGLLIPIKKEYPQFMQSVMESVRYKGSIYALPRSFEVIALLYNKDLVSTPPATVTQMIETARSVPEGIYGLMYDNKNFYYQAPWFFGFGAEIFRNGSCVIDSPEGIASFEFARKLETEYKIIPQKSNESAMVNMFSGGKAAMIITGPWTLGEIEKNGINYGVCPIPEIEPGKQPAPFIGVKGFGISKFSHNPDTALSVIEYFTGESVQREAVLELGVFPCISSMYSEESVSEKQKGFYHQALYGRPMPAVPEMKYVWQECNWALNQIFSSDVNVREITERAGNKIREEMAGK